MLSFTCSPPGSIIFSRYGHFLSPEEFHLVVVKPHSVSYFLTNQLYESSDPDVELPFEATVIGAHMFTLPSRQCSSIALITHDLTLIILSSTFSPNPEEDEQDSPIERTVCDQIRSTHVIPSKFSPLFASLNNQLFISVYPNSLCVITFSDAKSSFVLEKNEIHFQKFLPKFLHGSSDHQKIFSYDTVDDTIKAIDIQKVPTALEEQSYNSSSLLFSETIPLHDEVGADNRVEYFLVHSDQFLIFSRTELILQNKKEHHPLPNTSGVTCVTSYNENIILISFKNGEFISFDLSSQKIGLAASLRPFTSIVPIENGDVLLFSKNEQPVVFNVEQKALKFSFSNLLVNALTQTMVPHSVPGLSQLLVGDKDRIFSYGEGLQFNATTMVPLDGSSLFMVDDFVLVSIHDQTIVLNRNDGENVSLTLNFEANDSTVYFFKYEVDSSSSWYIQCCSKKLVAVNIGDPKMVISLDIEIQHAAVSFVSNSIIVASNCVDIVKFDGKAFTVSSKIDVNDEISSICICKEKFLVVSLWKNLAVFVYDIESGKKLSEFKSDQISTKFVVRSICESGGFVYFGTSRGDVICAEINETSGELNEICHSHISTSTVSLSSVVVNEQEYVCVSSDMTFLICLSDAKTMIIYPTNLGLTRSVCQVKTDNPENSVAFLNDSSVQLGSFGDKRIIRINQMKLNSTILKILSIDSRLCVALLKDEIVVIDFLIFEIIGNLPLDPNFNYTNCTSFTFGEDVIIAICAAMKTIEENKFSEKGKIIFVKNFNEMIENSTIETKSLPTAVTFVNNALFATIGPTIAKYTVNKDLQFTLSKEAPGMMLSSELIVSRLTGETVNISIVDAFKSVAVFDFDLHRLATDFLAKYLVTGCNEDLPSDASSSFLVTDSRGGVYLMKTENDRVVVEARMNVGEAITGISSWNPFGHGIGQKCRLFCGTSSLGSIVAFATRIEPNIFKSMEKIQKAMEQFLVQNGELSHFNYRCIYSPAYKESYTNYVDASFIAGILDFDEDDRNKIIADNSIENFEDIYEFLSLLEELNIQ